MIIARAAIMVAIEEYDENAYPVPPIGQFSLRQKSFHPPSQRKQNDTPLCKCGYFQKMLLCHWRFPLKAVMFNGCPTTKGCPRTMALSTTTTNDFPLKKPHSYSISIAAICSVCVHVYGYTSSWCWQLLIHVI